jgi:hypothetical protein
MVVDGCKGVDMDDEEIMGGAYLEDHGHDPLEGLPRDLVGELKRTSVCADCVHSIWTCVLTPQQAASMDKAAGWYEAYCTEMHQIMYDRVDGLVQTRRWCSHQVKLPRTA